MTADPSPSLQGDFEERPEGKGEEVAWSGEPIQLTHGFDRYFGGFAGQTFVLPRICAPAVRSAAHKILEAQASRGELLAELATRSQKRQELMRTLAREPDRAEQLKNFDADTEFLETVDIPDAEEAEQQAWRSFSSAFWGSRAETRQHVLEQLPEALRAAQTSVVVALGDLRRLQELNDVFDGAGVIHPDENDPEMAHARFERGQRAAAIDRIRGGYDLPNERIYGLMELPGEYQRALEPAPVEPEPEPEVETEEQRQERAWKRLQGVPEEPATVGVGRAAREFPG